MATIWKRVLALVPNQEIEVPAGAVFLCAREQHESLCLWFRCDPSAPLDKRKIAIAGTGHGAPEGIYIGTGLLHEGHLVLHVFETT